MKTLPILLFSLLLLVGCSTRGRFIIADIDLRSTEQIQAGEKENTVLFQGEEPTATKQSTDPSIIVSLIDIIKGRISLIRVEWNSGYNTNTVPTNVNYTTNVVSTNAVVDIVNK